MDEILMDELQWLGSDRPQSLLRFLLGTNAPRIIDVESFPNCRASARKLRLFACACYFRICQWLPDPLARSAVELAERHADGNASPEELQQVELDLQTRLDVLEPTWRASRGAERVALQPTYAALALAKQVCRAEAEKAAYYASSNAYLDFAAIMNPGAASYDTAFGASQRAEEQAQANLLRDIFGRLPFRPISIDDSWLTSEVIGLATTIYEQRSFDLLPVLGAALSDANCRDTEILGHCASKGPHVKGCFVMDLLLNKR
jgi:hypothetical protein